MKDATETTHMPTNVMLSLVQRDWLKHRAARNNRSMAGELRTIVDEKMREDEAAEAA